MSKTLFIVGAAVIGIASKRTTVTAPRVELRTGATVYGAVMSADGGASVASVTKATQALKSA